MEDGSSVVVKMKLSRCRSDLLTRRTEWRVESCLLEQPAAAAYPPAQTNTTACPLFFSTFSLLSSLLAPLVYAIHRTCQHRCRSFADGSLRTSRYTIDATKG